MVNYSLFEPIFVGLEHPLQQEHQEHQDTAMRDRIHLESTYFDLLILEDRLKLFEVILVGLIGRKT